MASIENIDYTGLSPAERLVLVQDILDSVINETAAEVLTADQMAEIERRAHALDSGHEATLPWQEVRSSFLGLT